MLWRNVGPFRGGRISATSGVIGQPGVFYVGLPAGVRQDARRVIVHNLEV